MNSWLSFSLGCFTYDNYWVSAMASILVVMCVIVGFGCWVTWHSLSVCGCWWWRWSSHEWCGRRLTHTADAAAATVSDVSLCCCQYCYGFFLSVLIWILSVLAKKFTWKIVLNMTYLVSSETINPNSIHHSFPPFPSPLKRRHPLLPWYLFPFLFSVLFLPTLLFCQCRCQL